MNLGDRLAGPDDELMLIGDFITYCKAGMFIDDDGFGELATKDIVTDVTVYPSDVASGHFDLLIQRNTRCTHVCWYNK